MPRAPRKKSGENIPSSFHSIIRSGRVRIARNLQGERFPESMTSRQRHTLCETLCQRLQTLPTFQGGTVLRMDALAQMERQRLVEQHRISVALQTHGDGAAVVLAADTSIAVMINEEDHIRIQVLRPNGDIRSAWAEALRIDQEIEEIVPYAYNDTLGFLTACPTNVGTGLRASVMVNLLGLNIAEESERASKALERLGFAVRGIWGEGSEASGHLYQVSNQQTLGETEEEIVDRLEKAVGEVVQQERNARLCLLQKKPWIVRDSIIRSVVILQNACYMPAEECLDFLSALYFGVEAGLVRGVDAPTLDRWAMELLPGHLQLALPGAPGEMQWDCFRAERLRTLTAKLKIK